MATAEAFGQLGQSFLDSTFADFKHTVQVYCLFEKPDGQGGHEKVWRFLAETECFILNTSGDEPFEAERKITHRMVNIHMRPIEGIAENNKIVFGNETFLIKRIDNIARKDAWLIIEAESGVVE